MKLKTLDRLVKRDARLEGEGSQSQQPGGHVLPSRQSLRWGHYLERGCLRRRFVVGLCGAISAI